jgi:uncharacterized protein
MKRLTAIAFLVLGAARAELPAVTYPDRSDQHLIDAAGVIPDEDEAQIRARAREALVKAGVPVVAVTIDSLAAHGAGDWTIERYAASLYNQWGIGEAGKNLGILLLVAVKDRKLRIATGAGHGSSWEARARGIIDREIVPRFKRGDVPGGVAAGVEAIVAELLQGSRSTPVPVEVEPPAAGGEGGGWVPRGTGIGHPGGGSGIGGLVTIGFLVMAGLAVISVLRGIFRRGSGGDMDGRTWHPRPRMSGSGWGGWGGLVTGGLLGYLGSRLIDGMHSRRRRGRSSWRDSSWGGGGGFGGGSSGGGGGSFGGGYTSGGGASGSW